MQKTLFILILVFTCLYRIEQDSQTKNLGHNLSNLNSTNVFYDDSDDFFSILYSTDIKDVKSFFAKGNEFHKISSVQFSSYLSTQYSKKNIKVILLPVSIDLPPPAML